MAKKNIILDGDIADSICCDSIKQHMGFISKDIAMSKKTKALSPAQTTELGENVYLLESLKTVYAYYGGKG